MSELMYLKLRKRTWYFRRAVPADLQSKLDGKTEILETLGTRDIKVAKEQRWKKFAYWTAQFEKLRGDEKPDERSGRQIYNEALDSYSDSEFVAYTNTGPDKEFAIDLEIERIEQEAIKRLGPDNANSPYESLPDDLQASLDALENTRKDLHGKKTVSHDRYLPPFSETASKWLQSWKDEQHRQRKDVTQSNTYNQYESTLRLFKGYCADRPLSKIRFRDGANFRDHLATLDPNWGRSPKAHSLSFKQLLNQYGNSDGGLSAATLNRHCRTLSQCWEWAKRRGFAFGDNPFEGLTQKVAPNPYLAWTDEELTIIANKPPNRQDLYEVFLVGLYSGMRVNEIASLTWENIREENRVHFFDIVKSKSDAGVREVPIHSSLSWLLERPRGASSDRLWPSFNAQKRGRNKNRPGDDVSSKFGDYKRGLGFSSRLKSFHSLRKNVTKIAERNQVRENEWREVIGHEKGLTYGKGGYNPDGITLEMKRDIIEVIKYPGVPLRNPSEIFGPESENN